MTFGVRGVGGQEILLITMGCNQATPAEYRQKTLCGRYWPGA